MKRNVLISCSALKKEGADSQLIWKTDIQISEWNRIVVKGKGIFHPRELYVGQHFIRQKEIIETQSDNLWIASAGLGLLDGRPDSIDKVNPYDASFSGKYGASTNCWFELPYKGLNKLLQIPGEIIIALPISYQKAIIADPDFSKVSNRITTLGPGPLRSQKHVKATPYHSRMIEIYGGQKLALFTYLLQSFYVDPIDFSELRKLKERAENLPPPPKRKRIDSEDELNSILLSLPRSISSGSKAVRYIRDDLNRSCSQERILHAWRILRN